MADEVQFNYVAVDPGGQRRRGRVVAPSEAAAFDQLRREGLSPVALVPQRRKAPAKLLKPRTLGDRAAADFLSSLADLLSAGADIRTALSILAARFERAEVKTVCQGLSVDISGGESLERAFARHFQDGQAFVASMVAAGEAAGNLPGGLQRAAEVMNSRLKLRDQLVSVLAYPSFVLLSALASVLVILLFIVPSIAPLAEDLGTKPPFTLSLLIGASNLLRDNLVLLGVSIAGGVMFLVLAAQVGALAGPLGRLYLDGPAQRTVSGLVYGSFSLSLGTMLAAGAPISDALRLAIRAVPSKVAHRRLEPVAHAVRQGVSLSQALESVKGFPPAIIRLSAVGEASNGLGAMLVRGGRIEEETAMRRIETLGRIAGPALIVFLGGLLGVLMGGLLAGVSSVGQSALS